MIYTETMNSRTMFRFSKYKRIVGLIKDQIREIMNIINTN